MSHVIDQRKQLLARVNRIIGQMNGVRRSIEEAETDDHCDTVMQQLAAVRGAMNGLVLLFLEEHVRQHVAGGKSKQSREAAAEDLIAALKSYKK